MKPVTGKKKVKWKKGGNQQLYLETTDSVNGAVAIRKREGPRNRNDSRDPGC
jgi:hypothetical protein